MCFFSNSSLVLICGPKNLPNVTTGCETKKSELEKDSDFKENK